MKLPIMYTNEDVRKYIILLVDADQRLSHSVLCMSYGWYSVSGKINKKHRVPNTFITRKEAEKKLLDISPFRWVLGQCDCQIMTIKDYIDGQTQMKYKLMGVKDVEEFVNVEGLKGHYASLG